MSSSGVRASSAATSARRAASSSSWREKICWASGGGGAGDGAAAIAAAKRRIAASWDAAGGADRPGALAAGRRQVGQRVGHVRQLRRPEAGRHVVLVRLLRGAADDLHERPQLPGLDPLLERQGADAVGVQPEGDVLAQPVARVDRLAVAEQALVRELEGQAAVLPEVLVHPLAEVLEELLVQRVVRQVHREAPVRLGQRLDPQPGGGRLGLLGGAEGCPGPGIGICHDLR